MTAEDDTVAAIKELPPHTRAVFCLHHYEGWTFAQIAEGLSISVRQVEIFDRRANEYMLKRLRPRG